LCRKSRALFLLALFCLLWPVASQEASVPGTPSVEEPQTSSSGSISDSLSAIDQLLNQLEQNSELSEAESLALAETLKQARFDLEQASIKLSKSEATVARIEPLLQESERTLLMYQKRSKILGYSAGLEAMVIMVLVFAGLIW